MVDLAVSGLIGWDDGTGEEGWEDAGCTFEDYEVELAGKLEHFLASFECGCCTCWITSILPDQSR